MRALSFAIAVAAAGCGGAPPAPAGAPIEKVEEKAPTKKHSREEPTMEYELGAIDPALAKKRFDSLKPTWDGCWETAHSKNEALFGKVTLSLRTNHDGSVKWVYVTQSDLGDRSVEKCMLDSIKATNFGPPMDAKEGEIKAYAYGWEASDDDHPADVASPANISATLQKAKKTLAACGAGAKGAITVTIHVAPKTGKALGVGVAVADPSAEKAVDCIVDVLSKLTYVNKSSWTIKSTAVLPP
jgi:hypothetical protein